MLGIWPVWLGGWVGLGKDEGRKGYLVENGMIVVSQSGIYRHRHAAWYNVEDLCAHLYELQFFRPPLNNSCHMQQTNWGLTNLSIAKSVCSSNDAAGSAERA